MTRRKSNANAQPPLVASHADRLRPWLLGGMTALFVARPLFPGESAAVSGDGMTMVMLWIVLAVFWLLGALGRPTFSIRFGWTDAAVLLLVGWHTVAALLAVKSGTPRPAFNMLWEWVGMGVCFFLARQLVETPREVRAVVVVMIALAVALSGYGFYQRFDEMPLTQAQYEADPDKALQDAGQWSPAGSPERVLFESRLQNREPRATFALTNSLAAFLAPWLVVLVGMGLGALRDRKRFLRMVLCLIPIAVCFVLTKSRSGYIAGGVGLALVWLLCREQRVRIGWKLPTFALGAAALLLAVALAIDGPSLFGKAWKSFAFRVQYWQSSVAMIGDHPLVGCGPGNFQNVYTQYKLPQATEVVADPHNCLLEIAATAGLPAAFCFVAIVACFFGATWTQRPIPDAPSDAWAYALVGGAAGFLLSVPLGLLSAGPPSPMAVLLGLPLAAATVALLWGWIRDGRLPPLLPAVGVAVLLVDLLTTGGIGYPSVAGTLWLLVALGLEGQRSRKVHAFVGWAALVAVIALAVACYQTAYAPVLGCQAEMYLAERQPARAIEHLELAAAADPCAAEPWRRLAFVELGRWQRQPSPEAFDRFRHAAGKAVELAPNSAPLWLCVGDLYFQAFAEADRNGKTTANEAIRKAIDAYRQAVQLYPNSELYREKLAEARHAAGN